MKAFLKKVTGSLKYALAFLPMAAALGGSATFFWLAAHGANVLDSTRDEVRSFPEYHELLESDAGILKSQLDSKLITSQEYVEKMNNLGTNDFLFSYLQMDPVKNKEYIDRIHKGDDMETAGIFCSVIFPLGSAGGIILYVLSDLFEAARDWAQDDFMEADAIKEEKKARQEYDEYKEEIKE